MAIKRDECGAKTDRADCQRQRRPLARIRKPHRPTLRRIEQNRMARADGEIPVAVALAGVAQVSAPSVHT